MLTCITTSYKGELGKSIHQTRIITRKLIVLRRVHDEVLRSTTKYYEVRVLGPSLSLTGPTLAVPATTEYGAHIINSTIITCMVYRVLLASPRGACYRRAAKISVRQKRGCRTYRTSPMDMIGTTPTPPWSTPTEAHTDSRVSRVRTLNNLDSSLHLIQIPMRSLLSVLDSP